MRIIFFIAFNILVIRASVASYPDSSQVLKLANEATKYRKSGDLINAINSVKQCIRIAEEIGFDEAFINGDLKLFLANRYSNIGDFDRAIELGDYLITYYRKVGNVSDELYMLNNVGVYHMNLGQYIQAYNYFFKGWQIERNNGDIIDKLDWLDGLASSCIKLGNLRDAQAYLNKSVALLRQLDGEDKSEMQLYYFINRAQLDQARGDTEMGLPSFKKASHMATVLGNRKGADAYNEMARIYLKKGMYKEVLNQKAAVENLLNVQANPYLKDPYLLQTYTLAAQANAQLGDVAGALLMIERAEQQAAYYHTQYMFNESKFYLDELRRKNLELGVQVCYNLFEKTNDVQYAQSALLFADKAKSNLLNERNAIARSMKAVSAEIRDLRFQWVYQLNEAESKGNSAVTIALRNRIDSLNNALKLNVQSEFGLQDLQHFQNGLSSDEMVLEYFFVDSVCYRFEIRENSIFLSNLGIISDQNVTQYYRIISNSTSDVKEYVEVGSSLYQKLILELGLDYSPDIKTIYVIPDKVLSLLSFETLPIYINKRSWGDISFLCDYYSFSYGFSLQSLAQEREKTSTSAYAGFAPDFTNNSTLAYLKNGESSITTAADMWSGNYFAGSDANENNLREEGSLASILHLYTHGVSSDSSYDASYIHLQDGKMYVDEILTLPLQTDLCLLTACEVGLGKNYSGEGATGVAWAFRGAGASNVVQSLWKLNEQTSSELMIAFFENLRDGLSSDKALSKAKQDYLSNPEISTRLKHPYYWAGMSHYGMGSLVEHPSFIVWWHLLLLFAGVLGVLYFIGRRSKSRV